MLQIHCPYCGLRPELEFSNGRDAHKKRPTNPMLDGNSNVEVSDAQWAEYVFMQTSTKGWYRERWNHTAGCRRWFHAIRHTVTNRIALTYKQNEDQPPLPEEQS